MFHLHHMVSVEVQADVLVLRFHDRIEITIVGRNEADVPHGFGPF